MPYTLMIVEDEHQLRGITADYLRSTGYEVLEAADGNEALRMAEGKQISLYILDWMLPGMEGDALCRKLRESTQAPILFLTAVSEEMDKLSVLEIGADDYMTKPFSIRELAVRVKVLLRRAFEMKEGGESDGTMHGSNDAESDVLKRGRLVLDIKKHEVFVNSNPVELTFTEFKILNILCKSPGRVYSRMQLLELAMGSSYAGYERTIDTHIRNLRKKIEHHPDEPELIITVFGVGYKFGENL
ncbi:response regulator transcription factor [Paenibacillus lemnae]|uniref:Response regulator transcription factor n=1 Tax=Paenibacillus lemnae TaxID=1330551 RepID=A0A848MB24_PAELE|nr:response regulator transcription factor [Paenibacillus lemnae]NMO97360.1 response regulator transcription factor [Paenibacillus lemnae]